MSNIEGVNPTDAKANFDILEIKLSLDDIAELLKGKIAESEVGDIKVIIKQEGR